MNWLEYYDIYCKDKTQFTTPSAEKESVRNTIFTFSYLVFNQPNQDKIISYTWKDSENNLYRSKASLTWVIGFLKSGAWKLI